MEINRCEIKAGLKKELVAAVVADLHSMPYGELLAELEKSPPT